MQILLDGESHRTFLSKTLVAELKCLEKTVLEKQQMKLRIDKTNIKFWKLWFCERL